MQNELKIKVEKRPLYLRVAQLLTEEITNGVFSQEERLPSEEKLAKMLGVSRATIREALSALEKQGMLRRVQGLGTILTHEQKIPIGQGMERLDSTRSMSPDTASHPEQAALTFIGRKRALPTLRSLGRTLRCWASSKEPALLTASR